MTAERTVTVPTVDQGNVTITEPSWCTGHEGQVPHLLSDTGHIGAPHRAKFDGEELAFAALSQDPFAVKSDRGVGVHVEMGALACSLSPSELDDLAVVLVNYAGTLRHLARQLSALRAGGEGR
ncbi:DUF6907 domain-containing protein [Streptomyces sp. NPDC014623]|uniref:DUF6907 domain-containing protein n=1 Tax=Streptomyces sp. NPDC014623 TaxID=3364875 RepID=UPI003701A2A2